MSSNTRSPSRPGRRVEATVKALRSCRFCGGEHTIAPDEPVFGDIDQIGPEIDQAIRDQQDHDGWDNGACPDCAGRFREALADEARAETAESGFILGDWRG